MMNQIEEIIEILRQQEPKNPRVEECLQALNNQPITLTLTEVRLNEALDIYERRADHNYNIQGQVEGFDGLLNNLRLASDEKVKICVIDANSKWYMTFTSLNSPRLLGILSKNKKASKFISYAETVDVDIS